MSYDVTGWISESGCVNSVIANSSLNIHVLFVCCCVPSRRGLRSSYSETVKECYVLFSMILMLVSVVTVNVCLCKERRRERDREGMRERERERGGGGGGILLANCD